MLIDLKITLLSNILSPKNFLKIILNAIKIVKSKKHEIDVFNTSTTLIIDAFFCPYKSNNQFSYSYNCTDYEYNNILYFLEQDDLRKLVKIIKLDFTTLTLEEDEELVLDIKGNEIYYDKYYYISIWSFRILLLLIATILLISQL
jgi:hypothetical protein